MVRKIIFGILFSVWIVILVLLSVWPTANSFIQQDISEFHWDYLEHFILYFIVGFLYIFWRINKDLSLSLTELIIFIAAGVIFSWLTEYIQVYIPGRALNIYDMISNMAGIISGSLISYFLIIRIFLKNWLSRNSGLN
jgi:VanZ family protein